MYLQVEVVDRDPVFEVAVKAVRLFDKQDSAGCSGCFGLLFEKGNHFRERGPPGLLGGFHIGELTYNAQPIL